MSSYDALTVSPKPCAPREVEQPHCELVEHGRIVGGHGGGAELEDV